MHQQNNTSVDILTQIYHDVQIDRENEDDNDSENVEDRRGIHTFQNVLRRIRYLESVFLFQRNEEIKPIITDLQCAVKECLVNRNNKQTSIKNYFLTL